MIDIATLKAQIRSILLALGRGATEREFRKEYYEIEGKTFNDVLRELGFNNAAAMLSQIPDVCRLTYTFENELFIQRVSNEETAHMDRLTITKKRKKKSKTLSFRPANRFAPPRPRNLYRPNPMPYNRPFAIAPQYSKPTPRPSYMLPVNYQYRPSPLTPQQVHAIPQQMRAVPQQIRARSQPVQRVLNRSLPVPSEPPLHMRHNVEKVTYKPQTAVTKATSVEAIPTAVPSTASVKPSPSSYSVLGTEKVVYKKSEKVVYDGDKEIERSFVGGEATSSVSSSTLVSFDSCETLTDTRSTASTPKEHLPRVVTYDQQNEAKITVTINQTPEQAPKMNPKSIRDDLKELRSRMAMMQVNKEIMDDGGLSCFVTTADIQIAQPELLEDPKWFDIKILASDAPDSFTFQFDFPVIEELQSNMKEFYDAIAETGKYLAKNLAINMVVAVSHSNRWYRAQVKSYDNTSAEIIPLDCMTLKQKTLSRLDIHYLHKKFTKESQKSGRGRIFGVLPKGGVWDEVVIEEFLKLKSEHRRATVKLFEDNIYHLSIIVDANIRLRIIDFLMSHNSVQLEPKYFHGAARSINMSLK